MRTARYGGCRILVDRSHDVFHLIIVMNSQFTIVFEPILEGGFTAFIPEVPGAISDGETVEESGEMVLDALRELTEFRRDAALLSSSRTTGPD